MSLINQMLRDLEQRQGQPNAPTAVKIHAATVESEPQRRLWPWLLPVLLATLYYGWSEYRTNPAQQPTVTPSVPPVTTVPIEVTPAPIAVAATAVTVAPTVTPMPTATPTSRPSATPIAKAAKSASDKTAPPAAAQTTKAHSPRQQQLQRLLQQAQSSSSLLMRKENLKEALHLDPENLGVREQLLATLIKSGNAYELESFLDDSLQLFPNHPAFITSQAQLQIQRKQYAAATATLERIRSDDPGYLALLAGSYQQQKRYRDGAEIYRRLTESQPQKAEHWLGLAICSDNLNQKPIAIQAYRQALDKNTLNAEVVDYINQRLSTLN